MPAPSCEFSTHCRRVFSLSLALLLVGCGGGGGSPAPPATFTIGGAVTGLTGTVVLQDNGGDNLAVAADGSFTFARAIAQGSAYSVTVLTQPTGQTCAVTSGSGTANANVAGVGVACTTNQYTIGGTATGLIRPLVLQDNLGDDLTVAADGSFVFAGTIAAGGTYSVTVLTPPAGELCTTSSDSGTANGNVTNIAVDCTVDADAFFIPFKATGQVSSNIYVGGYPPPTNGTNGLMVVASDAIGAAPTFISHDITLTLGVPHQFTLDQNGSITSVRPSSLVYLTRGATAGDHIWSVDLSAGSSLTPRQVGNFGGSFINTPSCDYDEGFRNLTDPTSAFFILRLPTDTTNFCGGGAASFNDVVIHLSDSATTTPLPVPYLGAGPLMLYAPSGALSGIVATDASQNLLFYPDETFTNPRVLMTGVFGISAYQDPPVSQASMVSSSPGFALIMVAAPDLSETVYRVDYTGAISSALYTFRTYPFNSAEDASNVYFVDSPTSLADLTVRIVQIPKDGSSAGQVIYSEVEAGSGAPQPYLIGSTGTDLVWIREPTFGSTTIVGPGAVQALGLGSGAGPRTIGAVPTSFSAFLSDNNIYVSATTASSDANYGPENSSEILRLDGSVVQAMTVETAFPSPWFPLQVRGITDPGGLGGGSVYDLDPANPAAALPPQVTLPDGSSMTLPTMTVTFSLWDVAGALANGSSAYQMETVGLVYDKSKHEVAAIILPYTNVAPVSAGN